jgi:3D (Asp-Asp-Asp) domain-containing protein
MVINLLVLAGLISSFSPSSAAALNEVTKAVIVAPGRFISEPQETHEVWVTAYSSTPEETDDSPFIVASGKSVTQGIIAANFLPFGTRVKIPEVFGDAVFIVEDRMARRKTDFVDIWMPTKQDALNFGIKRATIVVLKAEA